MKDSAVISSDIKNYITNHNIEYNMNSAINNILLNLPKDPYCYFIEEMNKLCDNSITILSLIVVSKYSIDFKIIPILSITIKYKGMIQKTEYEVPLNNINYKELKQDNITSYTATLHTSGNVQSKDNKNKSKNQSQNDNALILKDALDYEVNNNYIELIKEIIKNYIINKFSSNSFNSNDSENVTNYNVFSDINNLDLRLEAIYNEFYKQYSDYSKSEDISYSSSSLFNKNNIINSLDLFKSILNSISINVFISITKLKKITFLKSLIEAYENKLLEGRKDRDSRISNINSNNTGANINNNNSLITESSIDPNTKSNKVLTTNNAVLTNSSNDNSMPMTTTTNKNKVIAFTNQNNTINNNNNYNVRRHSSKTSNIKNPASYPNLGILLFKTGINISKVRFDKFYFILETSTVSSHLTVINSIQSLKFASKIILTSGKLGDMCYNRLSPEGGHYSPCDTVNDTLKMMEDIIKEYNKDSIKNVKISIGIDVNANNFYIDKYNKYEFEEIKMPVNKNISKNAAAKDNKEVVPNYPEAEEMIEYYVKLINDHPLITRLEDPLADNDIIGTKNLIKKIEEKANNSNTNTNSYSSLKIICKSIANSDISKFKEHFIPLKNEEAVKKLDMLKSKFLKESMDNNSNNNISQLSNNYLDNIDPDKFLLDINSNKLLPNNLSFCISNFCSINSFLETIKIVKSKKFTNITLWDSCIEYGLNATTDIDSSSIIDIAIAYNFDTVILGGLNCNKERFNSIVNYIKLIENNS